MPIFNCDNCGREFATKQRFEYHTNKNVCINKSFECKFCHSKFTSANGMYRHIRESCKVKERDGEQKNDIYERILVLEELNKKRDKENKKLKKLVYQMKKELDNIKTQPAQVNANNIDNVNINNITVNNTTNNINLVIYGIEDLTKLDKTEIIRVLQNAFDSKFN